MREDLILKLLDKIAKEENMISFSDFCERRLKGESYESILQDEKEKEVLNIREKARELIEEDPFLKMLDTVAKESGIVSFEEFCERKEKGESSESIFKEEKGE